MRGIPPSLPPEGSYLPQRSPKSSKSREGYVAYSFVGRETEARDVSQTICSLDKETGMLVGRERCMADVL
jgi:hypothetical protein